MIDKCDVRVPNSTDFTPTFGQLYAELRNARKSPFHSSPYYVARGDLRNHGYEAILHMSCKYGKGDHKVELIDVGRHGFEFLTHQLSQIFDINPCNLELMRVDLAADVPDVDVPWFLAHARARYKRFHNAGAAGFEYQQLGMKGIQTIYLGKRPNFIRIYNKTAEWQYQYRRLEQRAVPLGEELPSFESLFGRPESSVLTRVERQIGGKVSEQIQFPAQNKKVKTVGDLRTHAKEFDPFTKLLLIEGRRAPQPSDFSQVNQYLAVMQARHLITQMGMHAFYQWVGVHTNGNAWRWWSNYGQWVCDSPGITAPELYERYRKSVSQQLAA
jgi:hypothetical protein